MTWASYLTFLSSSKIGACERATRNGFRFTSVNCADTLLTKHEHEIPHTTDMNLGQEVPLSCFSSIYSRFLTSNHHKQEVCNSEFRVKWHDSSLKFLRHCNPKMTQQGKQMWVDACECFAHHSAKLFVLANGNRYEAGFTTFFPEWWTPLSIHYIALSQP
jgi:hypothetical protein